MARERWFWAQARQRRGPVLLPELVECVLGQPNPRAVLVWRKGFAEWTRAEDVPEIQRRIAPVVARREAEEDVVRRGGASAPAAAEASSAPTRPAPAGSNLAVYGSIAAGLVLMGLLGWLFWPRPAAAPQAVPLGGSSAEDAPAVVLPAGSAPGAAPGAAPSAVPGAAATTVTPAAAPTQAPAAGVAARETELPTAELRKLRGVAAWSGDRLKLTVYNGTAWRVTELFVRITRFNGDNLIEDPRPVRLVPPGAQVDEGVADLLSQVAPDRKKPGLNALDTGPFEGKAGVRPENFRWEVESARGYAPR